VILLEQFGQSFLPVGPGIARRLIKGLLNQLESHAPLPV
jgi:hypothetical protein